MDQTQYNTKINGCDIGSYSRMSKSVGIVIKGIVAITRLK